MHPVYFLYYRKEMNRYILGAFFLLFFHCCEKKGRAEEIIEKKGRFALLRVETETIEPEPSNYTPPEEGEEQESPFFFSPQERGEIDFFSFLQQHQHNFFLDQSKNIGEKEGLAPSLTPETQENGLVFSKYFWEQGSKTPPIGLLLKIFDWKILQLFFSNEGDIQPNQFDKKTINQGFLKDIKEDRFFPLSQQSLSSFSTESFWLKEIENKRLKKEKSHILFCIFSITGKIHVQIWENFQETFKQYYSNINCFSDKNLYYFLKKSKKCIERCRFLLSYILDQRKGSSSSSYQDIGFNITLNKIEKNIEWLEFFPKTLGLFLESVIVPDTDYDQLVKSFFEKQRFFRSFSASTGFFIEHMDGPIPFEYFFSRLPAVRNLVMNEIEWSLKNVEPQLMRLFSDVLREQEEARKRSLVSRFS